MKYTYADIFRIDLPEGHRFPMDKYPLVRERLTREGTIDDSQFLEPELCPREDLERVHAAGYVERVFNGTLDAREMKAIGFPWSPSLVRRSRCSVAGTIAAAEWALREGAAGNLAGGTHHAMADRGEGFCLFNDVAVAIGSVRNRGFVRRVAVVDCDVHQGNGTASIFLTDEDVFTLSLHGRHNWPFEKSRSTLDVEFDDGTGDTEYLEALERALGDVAAFRPELIFYVAGVDPLATDRLGRLSLTVEGLRCRDEMVYTWAKDLSVPIATSLGGGYSTDIDDIVEAHANTYRVAEMLFPG